MLASTVVNVAIISPNDTSSEEDAVYRTYQAREEHHPLMNKGLEILAHTSPKRNELYHDFNTFL